MKMKMRPRYYCDHCKKSGGAACHMRRHETGCTANPNRVCGLCKIDWEEYGGDEEQPPMSDLIIAAQSDFEASPVGDGKPVNLRKAAHNCPACMLAAIRQSGVYLDFDFEQEKRSWWSDRQRETCHP